ncbi:hypothetical protein Pla108_34060 [Botrimarina colliarenosi]|uniref:Beta-propeller repeat protein n=1 Tax=Botrimarina colliarenosi TaxID=2528001 RepID=A0A5C6A5K4_9BACT|nr:hypothetical protein [Botrimarina colliarenosi]TWT95262.1 hypothetical protein Pla108_34060 [Botrimarina colliarenosi]
MPESRRPIAAATVAVLATVISQGHAATIEWVRTVANSRFANDIHVSRDGDVLLAGTTDVAPPGLNPLLHDAFVSRFSPAGEPLATTVFGGELEDQIWAITSDSVGNAVVFTMLTQEVAKDRSKTPNLVRIDHAGQIVSRSELKTDRAIVSAGFDQFGSLAVVGYGESGYVTSRTASSGEIEWTEPLAIDVQIPSIGALDSKGSMYLTGTSDPRGNAYVAKVGSSGGIEWDFERGTTSCDYAGDAAVDLFGNVYAVGFDNEGSLDTGGTNGAFLSKLTPDGELQWTRNFGSDGSWATSIEVDAWGNAVVIGIAGGFTSSRFEPFLAVFDTHGELRDSIGLGGGIRSARSVSLDNWGNAYVALNAFQASGQSDGLVAKIRYVPESTGMSLLVLTMAAVLPCRPASAGPRS